MKFDGTVALQANSSEQAQKIYTLAGLPLSTGILFASLFAVAFWFYGAVWSGAPFTATDSSGYLTVARDLSDFHVDQLNARPPGYPMLLVLTGQGRPLFYTSLALHFTSIWLLSAVLFTMGLTRAWLVVPALFLLLPPYVEYAAYVLSDNLSGFFLVLGFSSLVFWFFHGRGSGLLIISGIAIAFGGLTRPTYQILALVIAGFLLVARWVGGEQAVSYRDCIRAGIILLTASVVLIGGYSTLNYVKFNFFGTYPMTGFNLSTRTVRFLERLPDQYAAEREALIKARNADLLRNEDHDAYLSYWKAIPELVKITGLRPIPDLSRYLLHLHLILIRAAPIHYLEEVFRSFSSYWLPSATELVTMNSYGLHAFWGILHFGILAVFILQLVVISGLAIFAFSQRFLVTEMKFERVLRLPSRYTFAYFLAGTIVFYNALATCLVEVGDPRYRIPTEPLIIFMCCLGLYLWRQLLIGSEVSPYVPVRGSLTENKNSLATG